MFETTLLDHSAVLLRHPWKIERVTLFFWSAITLFVDLFVLPIVILSLFGVTEFYGLYLGKSSFFISMSFLLYGLRINYNYFSYLLNQTVLEIQSGVLRVNITPIPRLARKLPIVLSQVIQFIVTEDTYGPMGPFGYRVQAHLKDGSTVTLIDHIWTKKKAMDYLLRMQQTVDLQ